MKLGPTQGHPDSSPSPRSHPTGYPLTKKHICSASREQRLRCRSRHSWEPRGSDALPSPSPVWWFGRRGAAERERGVRRARPGLGPALSTRGSQRGKINAYAGRESLFSIKGGRLPVRLCSLLGVMSHVVVPAETLKRGRDEKTRPGGPHVPMCGGNFSK